MWCIPFSLGTYPDVNHTLRLQGAEGMVNIAQCNISIMVHTMCDAQARMEAGDGNEGPAQVAAPTPDHWGARAHPDSAASVVQSCSLLVACVTILLSLFSWLSRQCTFNHENSAVPLSTMYMSAPPAACIALHSYACQQHMYECVQQ